MKRLVQLVAVVAVLVYVGAAVGQTAPKSKDTVKGALVSITIDPVDSTKATLVVNKEKQASVAADSTTKITLDGKAAKLDDLKVGDLLTVTLASGLAKKIEAKSVKTPAAGNVESGKKAETPAANEPFKGALVSITFDPADATKATLVVGKEKKEKINVDSTTRIRKDEADAKLSDLKVGELLIVTPGDKVAKLIVVAKTAKAPAATPKS